jgi:undecaprenyl-diphosphatase
MEIIHTLNQIDQQVFLILNGLHTTFLDTIMWYISSKTLWYPFYIVLIYFIILKRKKDVWITFLAIILMIILSDQLADLVKDYMQRLRPSHNPDLSGLVHTLRGYTGGEYGFVSSHASNAFAVAAFTALFFQRKWFVYSIFIWAVIVSFSRIYLGVHYPLDVICGGMLGMSIGVFIYYLEHWAIRKINKMDT